MSTTDPPAAQTTTGRRVLRNTIVLMVGDATSKLGLFVLYAVIARELGQGGFGDYTLAISLAFFVRAAALGIDLILSREVSRDLDNVHGLFWETVAFKLGAGVAVVAGVTVFAAFDNDGGPGLALAVLLIGLSNVIDVVALSIHSVLRGRELMKAPAAALALETIIVVIVGSVALLLGGGLVLLGVAYLVAAVVAFAFIAEAMHRHGIRPRVRGETRGIGWLAKAALPTGIASFFGVALARLDAVILSIMTGSSVTVGLYGGAYRIYEATLFLNWAFGMAIYPMLSRLQQGTHALRRALEISTKAISAVTMPVTGAMALFGPAILELLLGDDFGGGGTAIRILSGATFLYGVFTVAALAVAGQDRQDLFPWIGGAALLVNVVLNVVLIPPLSLNGSAIAMTAAQGVATGAMGWHAVRLAGGVSVIRMFAGTLAGLGAMALVALVLGTELWVLAVALPAYAAAFLAVERGLYPDDLGVFVRALRRRGLRPSAAAEGDPTVVAEQTPA